MFAPDASRYNQRQMSVAEDRQCFADGQQRKPMEAQMPRVATIRFLSALVLLLFATGSPVCYADPTVNAASEEQPLLLAVNDGLQQKETIGVTSSEVLLGSCVPLTGVIQKRAESVIDGASSYIDYVNDK